MTADAGAIEREQATCPKAMVYGPCGDVRQGGACDVTAAPCPFVERDLVRWPERTLGSAGGEGVLAIAASRPLVVGELAEAGTDAWRVRAAASRLAGHVDAALFGDTNWSRARLPPSYRAALVAEAGLRPWPGLNCRDRNRVALEGELAAMADVPVAAVHCVTGAHPLNGDRPDAAPVFDLDSTRLAALAASMGLFVSVAETPPAPPVDRRAARVAEKMRAGARALILPASRGAPELAAFVGALALEAYQPELVLASVPVVTSPAALERLGGFLGARLPEAVIAAARGTDPRRDGVRAAIAVARELLGVRGVSGVVLGVPSAPGVELDDAAAVAEVAAALGGGSP